MKKETMIRAYRLWWRLLNKADRYANGVTIALTVIVGIIYNLI